ncbi:hypothetical protein SAMN05421678_1177 [Actinopolymorpha cephalotaxi]|uniref:Polyketide cyclase / dehydrase and lipid transport n=1 Tax=Actinopolymorpha cephalotaxi TaxID=504797 RepID=A0A1I2ZQH4_9ACTN|nr:hypothetical protein [Actinopolymorpha cephalotaxi]NYH84106.1 hypothetical protein [Actinopolymorpha cephalotaxi]SFH40014.1 hypothetical protein SAMN05421678_1177 [Actinopolymorpha cephalotaxi]
MSVGAAVSTVGAERLPATVRTLSSLSRIDYADHFVLPTNAAATVEQWARVMFGDTPDVIELFVWRGLLGLRLSRTASADTVAGWQIGEQGDEWIRLEARSWFVAANLVVQATSDSVALGTFLRYDHWPALLVWPPLSVLHRRLVPGVLRKAATRIAAGKVRSKVPSR